MRYIIIDYKFFDIFYFFSEIYNYFQKYRVYPGKNTFFWYFEGYTPGSTDKKIWGHGLHTYHHTWQLGPLPQLIQPSAD